MSYSDHYGLSGSNNKLENLPMKELGVRLRAAREQIKMSRGDAATAINVALSTLQAWENGEREPGALQVKQLCDLYGVPIDNVMLFDKPLPSRIKDDGSITKKRIIHDTLGHPVNLDDFIFIPRYFVTASTEYSVESMEENRRDTMACHRTWLEDTFHNTRPENVMAISVIGDSMEPTLMQRDVILVDRSVNEINDGVFVISLDDRLMVKRLQRRGGNEILVISDNSAYPSIKLEQDRIKDLRVYGRVHWVGRAI